MVMVPKISIESPTARKVSRRRTGFLMLDLTVRPIVAGSLDVTSWTHLDDSLISLSPLRTSNGCVLEACKAGLMPETMTTSIVIAKISKMSEVSV